MSSIIRLERALTRNNSISKRDRDINNQNAKKMLKPSSFLPSLSNNSNYKNSNKSSNLYPKLNLLSVYKDFEGHEESISKSTFRKQKAQDPKV